MTTLQGTRKWVGLGKQGERFVTNVLTMVQPVLPPDHRAILSLSWMQYEKLKVRNSHYNNKKKNHVDLKLKCLTLALTDSFVSVPGPALFM